MLINILFRLVVEAFKWGIWDKILKYILSVVIVVFLNCNCCKEWKFLWVNVASLHLRCHVITVILNAVVCTSVIVIVDHKNLTSAENVIVVDDPDCDKATEVQTTVYSLTKSYDDCTTYSLLLLLLLLLLPLSLLLLHCILNCTEPFVVFQLGPYHVLPFFPTIPFWHHQLFNSIVVNKKLLHAFVTVVSNYACCKFVVNL